jgi:hypothetical protein
MEFEDDMGLPVCAHVVLLVFTMILKMKKMTFYAFLLILIVFDLFLGHFFLFCLTSIIYCSFFTSFLSIFYL